MENQGFFIIQLSLVPKPIYRKVRDMNIYKSLLRHPIVFCFALIGVLLVSSLALGATYYVAKDGSDSNPGTETRPWLTIQKAADTMVAGDIVYVKEGTYSQNVIIRTSGTSFDNMASYIAYDRHKAIIEGQIYFAAGSSYNKIDGFKCVLAEPYANIDMYQANCNYNAIRNSIVIGDGNGHGGIGYCGIGNIFEGNEVYNTGHGFHPGGTGAPDGTLFKNNIIHDTIGHGIGAVGGKNEKAIGNIVYNCRKSSTGGGVGIFFGTVQPENVWVEGNLVWGCERDGISVEGPNGTVILNTVVSIGGGMAYNLPVSGTVIRNNIGYRTGTGNVVILVSKTPANDDYNCFFNPDEPKCISRYYDNMDIVQYQTYGQGLHTISRDPKFVDSANRDFHLLADSPCIDAGDPVTSTGYDLDGRQRPLDGNQDGNPVVDMGAYEYPGTGPVYKSPPSPNPDYDSPGEPESSPGKSPAEVSDNVRNRPNPFRAGREETLIEYRLSEPSNVTITIYDLLGQEVWYKSYKAGENGGSTVNSVPWDGRNLSGEVVGNGGYICRVWIEREKRHMVKKMAVAK